MTIRLVNHLKNDCREVQLLTEWSPWLWAKYLLFCIFSLANVKAPPPAPWPSIIQWGRKRDNGVPRVGHLFELLHCNSLKILSATALYYPKLAAAWGRHTPKSLPFPPLRILGADNGDLGWPNYPTIPPGSSEGIELGAKIYVYVVDTRDTMDTRHAPKTTTALYWLPPKRGEKKHSGTGWGEYADTLKHNNYCNAHVWTNKNTLPFVNEIMFCRLIMKYKLCSFEDRYLFVSISPASNTYPFIFYPVVHPRRWVWIQNFPGNKIRFGRRRRLLVSCRYLQQFLSKCPLLTILRP